MKRGTWRKRIKAACEEADTYKPFFDLFIDQLAQILEVKDDAAKLYKESGGDPVVMYTNKGGHKNLRKNPALAVIEECNQQALQYWKELGLTSKSFAQMQKGGVPERETGLEDLLAKIGI